MVKRMLIDATHPEETRVVVVNGTRLEELDVETSTKKQLKGNIYLAKVVRVEPSLQAAFVEYGGNRHGFLAFSEIHPDYYQIPVADRQALLAEQKREALRERDEAPRQAETAEPAEASEPTAENDGEAAAQPSDEGAPTTENPESSEGAVETVATPAEPVDIVGGDEEEDLERRRPRAIRNYKIQDVIKRRQILLVQVVKEERGNKGAALTTYLSLAGRYCVLMPNTDRGGGVSRKITNAADRKRLKVIANELEIPKGMALIVRTAGSERTKPEIRRDYEYLLRTWDSVRDLTLNSIAPSLVYEEANLIKRAIRDLYSRDIEEVLVEGEEGYRLAKDFMRMLTPSHAKKIQLYKDPRVPLFHRAQVEGQLDAMHNPVVQLKSGGYIVINPTEALVSIDVNSGRATKERHIEETALKTNLEAADEIARQLRLRDLAGLIVIDFIDMEENRNNSAVERRLKEAMKNDRARIQLGRISPFGLLELSRQRLRPSLLETSFQPCPHCNGTGMLRNIESTAVYILRAIEDEGIKRRSAEVTVTVPTPVALYILNQKRAALAEIEARYDFRVYVTGDDSLVPPAYRMDRVKGEFRPEEPARAITAERAMREEEEVEEEIPAEEIEAEEEAEATEARGAEEAEAEGDDGEGGERRRRRRRRRRRGRDRDRDGQGGELQADSEDEAGETDEEETESSETDAEGQSAEGEGEADGERRRRRRGKRGGRRRNRGRETGEAGESEETGDAEDAPAEAEEAVAAPQEGAAEEAKPKRSRGRKKADGETEAVAADAAEPVKAEKPKRPSRSRKKADEPVTEAAAPVEEAEAPQVVESAPVAETAVEQAPPAPQPEEPKGPPKKGWWNRLIG